ncbi:MAG: exodeoxyribonuclease III [Clostridia bacterium]|nr:exodeoxyribonuclease III [Clostridia bacterium]MBQ2433997.1 exodeoxyribonuclease III [Clostridia bacterium]MBQ5770419.1 exodeoxyribonuclease III [Clostridia bacterium]
MKLVSWNVNGLRACWQKGFLESIQSLDADMICLQEIKLQKHQFTFDMEGYTAFTNHADKPGYSGTAIYTRKQPLSVTYGIGIDEHDHEGRVITAEFEEFYLVCCYTPNSQNELKRLAYRMTWEDAFFAYLKGLEQKKAVILCGDLNVAHKEIDLKNPKTNRMSAGFTDEEREKISRLLDSGFIDTFRFFHPDEKDQYSWWSYIGGARSRNAGWRIDYFLASGCIRDKLVSASIHQSIMGSDHCPVSLEIDVK